MCRPKYRINVCTVNRLCKLLPELYGLYRLILHDKANFDQDNLFTQVDRQLKSTPGHSRLRRQMT